jgi:hypothetical protein
VATGPDIPSFRSRLLPAAFFWKKLQGLVDNPATQKKDI